MNRLKFYIKNGKVRRCRHIHSHVFLLSCMYSVCELFGKYMKEIDIKIMSIHFYSTAPAHSLHLRSQSQHSLLSLET